MIKKIATIFLLHSCFFTSLEAQTPQPIKNLLNAPDMQGASFSISVKEVNSGKTLYAYDSTRELIPASVLKLITTATALEILGEDYRFPTSIEYDGELKDGLLRGNLYIRGSGDPTLGSFYTAADRSTYSPDGNEFIPVWIAAIQEAGIRRITGSVIADESIFDTEGISSKWVSEDLGNYYAAGSYGLCVFDNMYRLYLKSGTVGTRPEIAESEPAISSLRFHSYLTAASVSEDSSYIKGSPFSVERYLYGVVPAEQERYTLWGDIPDPSLFLAEYLNGQLISAGIQVEGEPTCYRILAEEGRWPSAQRHTLITTYSPALRQIVRIANVSSHNLYADALLKTVGLRYTPKHGEILSSYEKGVRSLKSHWDEKGLNTSSLHMYDGCGLALADKLTTDFICELLIYMRTKSKVSDAFMASLAQAGVDGYVQNFLKGSALHGKAFLKSGGLRRVRGYAGYIQKGDTQYVVAVLANNYNSDNRTMTGEIERLLLSLF